jgi:ribonuclease III
MSLKDIWRKITGPAGDPGGPDPDRGVDPEQLGRLETTLGHRFTRPELLLQALLHRSHALVAQHKREQSNERLEFLGDAVLGLVVNDHLYRDHPVTGEGDLTKMKSLLVCRERLAEVGARLDLGSYIRMSHSEAATGGRGRASILADTTEAVIGAVYLDGGLAAARRVIESCLLADSEHVLLLRGQENFKSRLQETIQARYKSPPRYRVVAIEGPDHARRFRVSVSFNGQPLGEGVGPSKKIAEQAAARQALAEWTARGELQGETESPPDA